MAKTTEKRRDRRRGGRHHSTSSGGLQISSSAPLPPLSFAFFRSFSATTLFFALEGKRFERTRQKIEDNGIQSTSPARATEGGRRGAGSPPPCPIARGCAKTKEKKPAASLDECAAQKNGRYHFSFWMEEGDRRCMKLQRHPEEGQNRRGKEGGEHAYCGLQSF